MALRGEGGAITELILAITSASCQLTEVLDGALSKLLWLDTDGVRVRRGGNDLLWCCRWECRGIGWLLAVSKEPVLTAPWYCGCMPA